MFARMRTNINVAPEGRKEKNIECYRRYFTTNNIILWKQNLESIRELKTK